MAKKKNNQGLYIMIGLIVMAIIVSPYLGKTTYITNEDIINQLETENEGECLIVLDNNVVMVGDEAGGTITDGANTLCEIYLSDGTSWINVGEGTTSQTGLLHYSDVIDIPGTFMFRAICGECVTNIVNLKVNPIVDDTPPEDEETWEIGDIVDSGGGSGLTTGEGFGDIIDLAPGDNPCTLGIRINTEWTSWSDGNYPEVDGECFNPNYQAWQSLYWSFQDSNAQRWSDVMDAPPVKTLSVDICPAYYTVDGTPWQIQMQPAFDDADFPPPGCQVGYSYDYEIYNCECP